MRIRRSLIDLDDLSAHELQAIFERTGLFEREAPGPLLKGVSCVNMFFEESTRTFTSFHLAELRLGADVVNLAPKNLSLATKGETLEDTAITLGALGIRVVVVRHSEAGFPARIAVAFDGHVVNAGDGTHAHPTQALLDLATLHEEFGRFDGLRVAIVGDILHSRVARSNIVGMRMLGIDVTLVGPPTLLPDAFAQDGVRIERVFDDVLPRVDAVMMLRIQRERISASLLPALADYTIGYQLSKERLRLLPQKAIVLHPGPYNRGVELTDDALADPRSRYEAQVTNGVYVRMAALDLLVNGSAVTA